MRINIGSKFYPVIAGCKILSMLWNVQMSIQVWLEINYMEPKVNAKLKLHCNTLSLACRFG